jgi:UDP-N-acetylglucosamine 1-carboxyvinyltransferase
MARFKIVGATPLVGNVKISGAKNEALKAVALSLNIKNKLKITNAPQILDVVNQGKILKSTGSIINICNNNEIIIDTTYANNFDLTDTIAGKLRASIVFAGPLLARFKSVKLPYPGGCLIGCRSIDTHLDAFRQIGAKISEHKRIFSINIDEFHDSNIILKEKSVTATENIVMFASAIAVKTKIDNCAIEPEIIHLLLNLQKAGAQIDGIGTRTLIIKGSQNLKLKTYEIITDRIEAGTFVCAMISSGGEGEVSPYPADQLESFTRLIKSTGANFDIIDNKAIIKQSRFPLKPFSLKTGPFPEFPTDLQSPMSLLALRAKGVSLFVETMFENRLSYLEILRKMGASIKIIDRQTAEINGPCKLRSANIESLDLRSGITLLLAATMSEGETFIEKAEIIDRGYEKIDEKLKLLGANIERINS